MAVCVSSQTRLLMQNITKNSLKWFDLPISTEPSAGWFFLHPGSIADFSDFIGTQRKITQKSSGKSVTRYRIKTQTEYLLCQVFQFLVAIVTISVQCLITLPTIDHLTVVCCDIRQLCLQQFERKTKTKHNQR